MPMVFKRLARLVLLTLFIFPAASFAFAQVNSVEITNPRLKEPEQTYFHKLITLNQAIARISYPYPFSLRRYIGLGPKNPLGNDKRGLEFVLFHGRVLLKVSGDYHAAFNSALTTDNQRARRVFNNVALPILRILPQYFSPSAHFDGFGIEVAYHVQTESHAYEYEGVEILTMVFNKAAAFSFPQTSDAAQQQEILDGSGIYLNGKRFGLALEGTEPYPPDTLGKEWRGPSLQVRETNPQQPSGAPKTISQNPASSPAPKKAEKPVPAATARKLQKFIQNMPIAPRAAPVTGTDSAGDTGPQPTLDQKDTSPADLQTLEHTYQQQFDTLAKEGAERFHLVSYAPPSLVTFHNRIYLQLTLRNPAPFNRATTSIYKRAAQDFDLFLAPLLKPLLSKVPYDQRIAGLDVTVLSKFGSQAKEASEAIEFISPLALLRQFTKAEVTSQDVINHSVVLVNGVRIGLNLQQVE